MFQRRTGRKTERETGRLTGTTAKVRWAAIGLVLVAALNARSAIAAGEVRIALLPMIVHSAESPDYLRAGLADMLTARLEQVEGLEVMRVDDLGASTNQINQALASGRALGADFVLFGSFTRFGQGASLDVQCAATRAGAASEPLREIFVHSGSIGDVIPDLDELVGKITRFVVQDFAARQEDAPELSRSAEAESRSALEALRRRVEVLEGSVSRLQTSAGAPPLEPPAAVEPSGPLASPSEPIPDSGEERPAGGLPQ